MAQFFNVVLDNLLHGVEDKALVGLGELGQRVLHELEGVLQNEFGLCLAESGQ